MPKYTYRKKKNYSSKVEQQVIQLDIWFLVDALAHKKSQFVGVLAGGRHSNGPLWHDSES